MAEPISILELKQEDGSIVELPVMQGDTPEVLSNVLKKNGYDPSKYLNEITQALGGGGGNEDLANADTNPLTPVYKEKDKPADNTSAQYIKQIQDYARSLPFGSKEQKKAYDVLTKELAASKGTTQKSGGTPPKFTAGQQEDITTLRNIVMQMSDLLELKNSGFGGKGIDTGPIVGGAIPIPFSDTDIPFVGAGASEWWNKTFGDEKSYESASDRAKLRQLEKFLFNPVKHDISGSAVSNQESFFDIKPMVPGEADNDQAFFSKGLETTKLSINKLKTMLDTAQKSGIDISQYKDIMNLDADKMIEDIKKNLSKNPNGSFAREFPDTFKKYSTKELKKMSDEELLNSL